ncbi:nucleoside hydrolase [Prochlorothrix hollandica]|uniref:Nucleoside hydrolase n=1 Tax=Prochlorothrix hollandica PCC 9006 = CALU 1027 TaxID=317619 RepID=A0A0M2Q2W7_PROHO|nr:nucleoside hydrolase [Prochlorothrix hollandica]KKJ00937.1 nucleoside hydrolase [Prochlorothrix hollandica PCC 9006 = CALU 1027]
MSHPKPIIIDCDPGIDDAVALFLAMALDSLDVKAIITVAGNMPLAVTERNARCLVELAQRSQVKVYGGCPRPLLRSPLFARHVHGDNGLGGLLLPDPQVPLQPTHGVTALIEILRQSPEPVSLATLGPLTNLAVALVQAPDIAPAIAEIVIMGGAMRAGNVTPSAEFNFYADPHAAQIVMDSGIPLTLIGLDVTHQVIATPPRLERIRQLQNPVAQAVVEMVSRYGSTDQQVLGLVGPPLHDPCVIAYLVQPDLFETKPGYVAIETASDLNLGRSVVDFQGLMGHLPNATVALSIDSVGFYELLLEALSLY